ncbi:MAG: hypothetical protein JNL28_08785 [Planctomycetes bacterium]|nr:hypothetical protein [Planctomycetota bacterium]
MISFRSALAISFLSIVSVFALGACHTTPTPVGIGIRGTNATKIMERSPIDIAVLPVVTNGDKRIPSNVLRAAIQQGLVERRYSPLALEYVDRNVTEASYTPGASQEHAVCTIQVESWDASLWDTHNVLTIAMNVKIDDAASGANLWTGSVNQRFEFGQAIESLPTQTQRVQRACDILAAEMLQKLPLRDSRRPSGS